jgi:deoxycytidylate deaminase
MVIDCDPPDSGPCAKMVVTATVVALNGKRYRATNYCRKPQLSCARAGMPSGVGYELCKSVCDQPEHAEVNAVLGAGPDAAGATVYLVGHTYACQACVDFCVKAGASVIVGSPPEKQGEGC